MVWFQVTAKLVQPKGALLLLSLLYTSLAALGCSLVIVQLQGESVHLANSRRLIFWENRTIFITLSQLN